jgi:hypothetical protein
MKYNEHRHDAILKPGEQFDPSGKAAPELHELLERKGFIFQTGSDYYLYGKDEDWQHKPFGERPLISAYESGTWDGRPVPGYPMKAGTDLKDYLDSLPDVARN